MIGNLTGWHALILLAVILLLFGATRLPALARSVGQSARIFRSEVKTAKDDPADEPTASAATVVAERDTLTAAFPVGATVPAVATDGAHGNR